MNPLIDQNRPRLGELCRRYGMRRLFLFGSAASGRFRPQSSDLDFVVELTDREPTPAYAERSLGLADDLERLFDRPVDLITAESIRNPFLRGEIEETRQLVYGEPG